MTLLALVLLGCTPEVPEPPAAPPPQALKAHCDANIGQPRIEQITDDVWVALGYDLANTTLIRTSAGNVVIDPGMSPSRAAPMREALLEKAPGPIAAIIYTHSHIDHVGGASVWAEPDTRIWATEAFEPHFFEQYSTLLKSERARAARQFGLDVPVSAVPCSAIGRRPDIPAALEPGAMLPTDTMSGVHTLTIGQTEIELVEAHGETHDQLFVWLPEDKVLLPGDNWYRTFPNLYTVRGTRPRDVDAWIHSLDRMREKRPEILVPSHTTPVRGADAVQHELRVYRDGIQWVRDAVIRGANQGKTVDELAASIHLPPHLASESALTPLYGEIEWSVRAIYGNRVGWFDGRVDHLYPLPPDQLAANAIDAFGGPQTALETAKEATDPRWALTVLGWLRDDGRTDRAVLAPLEAKAARDLAKTQANSNGRSYLLQAAREAESGVAPTREPTLSDAFVKRLPVAHVLEQLTVRLDPVSSRGVHETVVIDLGPDEVFVVTVRDGVCEVHRGDPLPGTPRPIGRIQGSADDFRRLSVRQLSLTDALGKFEVEGSPIALAAFFGRFERGL